ncbi:MAG TPA: hypothetical protein VKS60_00250 [Stellaceae bacterium]|nr:hypothetical protein [Stellaceae bacterium]
MQYAIGSGSLWGTPAGGSPLRFGALQDCQIDHSFDLKEIYGTGSYPIEFGRGKAKIEIKAKLAVISGPLFNAIYFGGSLAAGQILVAENELQTVPSSSAYTVTVANSAHFLGDQGVIYAATGLPLTQVASGSEATGKYSVAAGVYTFAAGDAGAQLAISYVYSATTGWTLAMANPRMGVAPKFSVVFSQSYNGLQATLQYYSCAAAKLSMPSKLDDWTISELDFVVGANAAGNVGQVSFSQ